MASIKITSTTSDEDLENLKGVRVLQLSTPSEKYFGFEIHNFENEVASIEKVPGGKLKLELEGVENELTFYSAVLSYELTGLSAIADFERSNT